MEGSEGKKNRKVLGELQLEVSLGELLNHHKTSLISELPITSTIEGTEGMKNRKLFGEVQLEVSLGELLNHRSSPANKRLSEVLNDQRSLKEQYNATAQQLFKRDQTIDELTQKVAQKNGSMEKLESEKGKLLGEMKQLCLEKEQLNSLLQEELDVRKNIQVESQKLITDIKGSYEHKISKLKDEIKTKEEVVSIKQDFINDLESLVNKLRTEINSLNSELQKARCQERETQGRMSRSFRGSLSMMQSQLSTKSQELENQIKNMEIQHVKEIETRCKEFESVEAQLKKTLDEKLLELEEVRGRLDESREAREKTLSDMHNAKLEHATTVKQLKEELKAAREEICSLQSQNTSQNDLSDYVQELETQLQHAAKENYDLNSQLDLLKEENANYAEKNETLETTILRLEANLAQVEKQKEELYEKAQEYLKQSQVEKHDSSTVKLLQKQLENSQIKLDEVKENLIAEKHRSQTLSQRLSETDKDYQLAKVDVRILTRDKTKLESSLTQKEEKVTKLQKELEEKNASLTEMEKKVKDLEQTLDKSKSKSQEDQFQLEHGKRMLEESKEQKQRLEALVQELKKELSFVKGEVGNYKKMESDLKETSALLNKKDGEILQQARKIGSLQANLAVLKEALTVLDNQLRDFESVFALKVKDLEASEDSKGKLALECSSLKETLQKAKIDLNETLSLKAFLERRLNELQSNIKQKEEQSSETVSSLQLKVEEYKSKNTALLANSNKLAAEVESTLAEKECLKTRLDEVNKDNYKLTQELHKFVDNVFALKHETIKLQDQIKEIKETSEAEIAELKKLYSTSLQAKDASNIQMQCTINQQAKLIQFLQDQNESLSKKKKFTFFCRDKEESTPTPTPTKKGVTLPRKFETPTTATPTNRIFQLNERHQSALTLGKCNETELLAELNELKKAENERVAGQVNDPQTSSAINCEGNVRKTLILKDEKQQLDVNCVFHIVDDLYLLGCDQGLFSRKKDEHHNTSVVKIDGMLSVNQIEFVSSLNAVLFIEGTDQKLMLASIGMVRTCAEAAECSQPRMSGSVVSDIRNCHMFQLRDIDRGDLIICVTTQKHLHILSWKNSTFVLRQKISTPEVVTCMLLTPESVIYGSGKIWELDTKNYQLQEFLDETDISLYFVIFGSDDLTIPMAIIDVGMSNWTPEKKSYTKEYLICYPTLGIFVDEDGHRTRGEDIAWQKFPHSINYRHPNLYIFHHSSVEVIRLNPESFTKKRVNVTKDSVGEDVSVIPSSSFIQFPSPHYLGRGSKMASIVLSTRDKQKTEIYDIDFESHAGNNTSLTEQRSSAALEFTISDSECD